MPEKGITKITWKNKIKVKFHPSLASGRWFTLSIAEQLGNIGSEVGRALIWKEKNTSPYARAALERALELFDLSLADERWSGGRRREIARAREFVCDFLAGDNEYKSDGRGLKKYFDAYALVTRRLINK